ncbi:MAG TPA: hypothetical protein VGD23_02705 [Sphingomicrobium sp.]
MIERAKADYRSDGYAHLPALVPLEICNALLARMKVDLARQGVDLAQLEREGPLLRQKAAELYGYHYPMFTTFLWGMTPTVETLTGAALLPTYCYFRLYRTGDICRVHSDRPSCEHSLSLTLGYSDGLAWPLEVSSRPIERPVERADEDFAVDEPRTAIPMQVGDAVLYRGVHRAHGRTTPNPNQWSAHLFLHWVDRNGPYADQAFDGQPPPSEISF